VGALLLTVMLLSYINISVGGGLPAKQSYPANFGLLATAVASSPDNIIVADIVERFKDTEFTFAGGNNRIDVTATTSKAANSFFIYAPNGTTVLPFKIGPATGTVSVVKEGNTVAFRGKDEFNTQILSCPRIETKDASWQTLTHSITTNTLTPLARLITSRLPNSKTTAGNGITLALKTDTANRIVAYYNPAAPADVQLKSRKLGCTMINAMLRGNSGKSVSSVAVVPAVSTNLPISTPGIMLSIGPSAASDAVKTHDDIIKGLGDYYG